MGHSRKAMVYMDGCGNGVKKHSQGEAETCLGCRAETDQGDEHVPNVAADEMAGVSTSLTLHAVNCAVFYGYQAAPLG